MLVTSAHKNEFIQISCTCPTVIQPGEKFQVDLNITAMKTCRLSEINWDLAGIANRAVESEKERLELNTDLLEGKSIDQQVVFTTSVGQEGFGEIQLTIGFSATGSMERSFKWNIWASIFQQVAASDKNGLEDDLRKRLVEVVNCRTRNGHIFMADHVRFFSEFLNIELSATIAAILTEELLLKEEGLPVNEEVFYSIITGQYVFYGMEKLELIYEENCKESDDKFEIDDAREVATPVV